MSKNSTLKLQDLLLKIEHLPFERSAEKENTTINLEAKKETINTILAYSRSVQGIKTQSNDRILISLN
jgi:hypothetical protein